MIFLWASAVKHAWVLVELMGKKTIVMHTYNAQGAFHSIAVAHFALRSELALHVFTGQFKLIIYFNRVILCMESNLLLILGEARL